MKFSSSLPKDYDERIIEGILQNSNEIMTDVYKQYFKKIEKMVYSFHNTILEPEEIFQEGFTLAIINVKVGKFKGESSFYTYLNSICRNICLKQLSKKRDTGLSPGIAIKDEDDYFNKRDTREIIDIVLKLKQKMDDKCKTIIDLRFLLGNDNAEKDPRESLLPFNEIGERLQLSAVNARKRFSRCLAKLKEMADSSRI